MGASQNKLTVVTLNYSGIYLSPFEYYGIDNWQELEDIGRIFEKNLKEQYEELKNRIEKIQKDNSLKATYSRSTFKWDVGDIDKDIHEQRYSPLYASKDSIKEQMFAGINKEKDTLFMETKQQFLLTWQNKFNELRSSKNKNDQPIIRTANNASQSSTYQCSFLDFLCYQAIIQYLYLTKVSVSKFPIKGNSQISFNKMIDSANNKSKPQDSMLLSYYRTFMKEYFKRIDVETKIKLTINNLFQNHKLDIICLIEATHELRVELKKMNQYYLFGPKDEKAVKQCILMVRKELKFISKYYQPQRQEDNARFRKDLDNIYSKPVPSISQINESLNKHVKDTYKTEVRKIMNLFKDDMPKVKLQIQKMLDKYSQNSLKAKVQDEISSYMQAFQLYCSKNFHKIKGKDEQQTKSFLKDLKQKGMLFWATDVTFAKFQNQSDKIIIASFHLSSKPDRNRIEVLLIGIIISYLQKHDFKYIFGGDFNSYITVEDESIEFGLFDFIKEHEHGVEEIIKKIQIYPRHPKMITTKKKRTILQPQIRKVNELVEKCIDQVLTNLPIIYSQSHIGQIDQIKQQKRTTQSFLPHLKHPYDHLLVQTKIDSSSLGKAPDCR